MTLYLRRVVILKASKVNILEKMFTINLISIRFNFLPVCVYITFFLKFHYCYEKEYSIQDLTRHIICILLI
jgi:hypothetical protein